MNNNLEITVNADDLGHKSNIGGHRRTDDIVAKGLCPYCETTARFRQVARAEESTEIGFNVPVKCDGCDSIFAISFDGDYPQLYPSQSVSGVDENLPDIVDKYYNEALDCMSARSPSGAACLFRKTIHAIGIYYDIADRDEYIGIYDIITELEDDGHINEGLKDALLEIKDLGNDGAHINENEPTLSQIRDIKSLIDGMLLSTVVRDEKIDAVKLSKKDSEEDSK